MNLGLTIPEAQAGAYEWAAVLLAHGLIGLALVAVVAAALEWLTGDHIDDLGLLSWLAVVVCYAVIWEGAVQAFGAGPMDAAVDTFAVACGGFLGLSAWMRRGVLMAVGIAAFSAVAFAGIWRRKK